MGPVLNHGRLCPIFSSTVLQRISRNKNERSARRLSNVKLLRMVMPRRCHSFQMHLSSLVRVTGRMSPRLPLVVSSSPKRLTSGTPSQLLNKATGPRLGRINLFLKIFSRVRILREATQCPTVFNTVLLYTNTLLFVSSIV